MAIAIVSLNFDAFLLLVVLFFSSLAWTTTAESESFENKIDV